MELLKLGSGICVPREEVKGRKASDDLCLWFPCSHFASAASAALSLL